MSDQRELRGRGGVCVFLAEGRRTGLAVWGLDPASKEPAHVEVRLDPEDVDWLIQQLEERRAKK